MPKTKNSKQNYTRPQSAVTPAPPAKPTIVVTGRQLSDVICDLRSAFRAANVGPEFFLHGGRLVQWIAQHMRLREVTAKQLYGIVAAIAVWVAHAKGGKLRARKPDRDAVTDLIENPDPQLPVLRRVVKYPVFTASGQLLTTPGYDRVSGLLLAPARGLGFLSVPPAPTTQQVSDAVDLLRGELLGDFPFADEPSRCHAIALFVERPVREMIPGPTPLRAFDAPTPGTGKGLGAAAPCHTLTGAEQAPTTLTFGGNFSEEELRRKLTGVLAGAPEFVLIDNVHHRIDSATFASLLTATSWTDRLMKTSNVPTLPNTATWIVTGNNLAVSSEIKRRTVWIRLDAKMENPHERNQFKHPDLLRWIDANRTALVTAILTIVQGWIAAGRPESSKSLGSYERWAAIMGGIMEFAGIKGFLEGTTPAIADPEAEEFASIVAAWRDRYPTGLVSASDLLNLIEANGLAPTLTSHPNRSGRLAAVGAYLGKVRDRVVDGHRLVGVRDSHAKTWKYRLDPLTPASTQIAGGAGGCGCS